MGNVIGKGMHTLYPQTATMAMGNRLDEDCPSKLARKAEREIRKMAFLKIVKAERTAAGRIATEPTVAIAENGQVRFNSLSTKHVFGAKYLAMDNPADRDFTFVGIPALPKDLTEADVIVPKWKDKDGNDVKNVYFSFAGMLAEIGYDYRNSGNQVFPAVVGSMKIGKNSYPSVTITVPKGRLTPKEVKPRQKREKAIAAPVTGNSHAADDNAAANEALSLQ